MYNKLLSISDFAKFSRVTKAALLHYDKIGLLVPVSRGKDNQYRYYSTRQLTAVNVIRTLQEFGLSLNEIKALIRQRTPKGTSKLFMELMGEIDKKMLVWHRSKQLLFTLLQAIHSVLEVDEEAITIQNLSIMPIILGEPNDYRNGRNDFDALLDFYNSLHDKQLDMNYPVWGVFSKERIKKRDWKWPDRYYFCNPEGPDRRPGGQYAVGYTRGGYGQTDALYERLLAYIDENGLELCGDCYEEYPLNEISVSDDTSFLIQVLMRVRKKT